MLKANMKKTHLLILTGISVLLFGCNAGTTNTSGAILQLSGLPNPLQLNTIYTATATITNLPANNSAINYSVNFTTNPTGYIVVGSPGTSSGSCSFTVQSNATSGSCPIQVQGVQAGSATLTATAPAINQTVNQSVNIVAP